LPPLALATWQTGLALLIFLAVTDTTGIGTVTQDWHAAPGLVVGLGALGTGAAFVIYYHLVQELGAVAASGSAYLPPVVALGIGWLVGERVGLVELSAITLILCGVAVLLIGLRRDPLRAAPPATAGPDRTRTLLSGSRK
jgi:drug/metabolite transporter (DMT)-like permease